MTRGWAEKQRLGDLPAYAKAEGSDIEPKWDLMYFIESMDNRGNGNIHPDLEQRTPYFIINLNR